ncbi:MAG TPA: hypothetical protein VMG10_20180 [Gemmataceae bacterium]|nr:hypothetical protein [Gemmataceae bacterium]
MNRLQFPIIVLVVAAGTFWLIADMPMQAAELIRMQTAPAANQKQYVLDIEGKLWLEFTGLKGKDTVRLLVDKNVQAIAPAPNGAVYILGRDGNLFEEKIDWEKNGGTVPNRPTPALNWVDK